jgi:transposase-like protein
MMILGTQIRNGNNFEIGYKHHGVSPQRFPLYLYEMQFRYNNRKKDLFDLILDTLVKPVPDIC